ncbi:MAG: phosphoribosylformimino-5-aminoimidazole carboxamide ribotide isomerase [Lachnospiraceae bacterium]|nr:phosphoribosylformimino-5-aminoimidazole carboxamide ribotide isomerase [Lachnospiraceae bacterium]MBQ9233244.1 phosphoribosylformimino-5-aminoimidazole carboxamide ribotide isomerase [Lachnospiraceae bacterium]
MNFRPCIDIHNGKVKQIVGGSLKDEADSARDNFVSELEADFYAKLYKKNKLKGGHIIILNPKQSEFYNEDLRQAKLALSEYPGGLQIGGGITADNAKNFIDMGADKVIVTSYVFKDGHINYDNLEKLERTVGKEKLVLDLSCRKKYDRYYIVTDRWQNFTDVTVDFETLDKFSEYCSEYLIHAVDVEGKSGGIEEELAKTLGEWARLPVTYAGGVGNFDDLKKLKLLGKDKLDVTIGSALDIFGGSMSFKDVIEICK